MNIKRMSCTLAVIVGVLFLVYAAYLVQQGEAKTFSDDFKDFFTHNTMWNPLITFFGGEPQKEVSKYDGTILTFIIAGIVLILSGAGCCAIFCRKKKGLFK